MASYNNEVPFHRTTDVKELATFLAQLAREGITYVICEQGDLLTVKITGY